MGHGRPTFSVLVFVSGLLVSFSPRLANAQPPPAVPDIHAPSPAGPGDPAVVTAPARRAPPAAQTDPAPDPHVAERQRLASLAKNAVSKLRVIPTALAASPPLPAAGPDPINPAPRDPAGVEELTSHPSATSKKPSVTAISNRPPDRSDEPVIDSATAQQERIPLGLPAADPWPAQDDPATPRTGWIDSSGSLNTLAAMGVVIAVIYLLRWVLIRMGKGAVPPSHPSVVEVLARVAVSPKSHVLLIRAGRRVLVVAESATGLRALGDIDDPEEVAGLLAAVTAAKPQSITQGFTQLVRGFNEQHDEIPDPDPDPDPLEAYGAGSASRADRARDQVSRVVSRVRALSMNTRAIA